MSTDPTRRELLADLTRESIDMGTYGMPSTDPTPIPAEALDLDALMELATPLLREAFDEMPPEQAAVTALGRRIRAEVERIYVAGRTAAAARLRYAAEGRRTYARSCPEDYGRELLNHDAVTLDFAAEVVEGNDEPLYGWAPSWMWTDEMHDALNAREVAARARVAENGAGR